MGFIFLIVAHMGGEKTIHKIDTLHIFGIFRPVGAGGHVKQNTADGEAVRCE